MRTARSLFCLLLLAGCASPPKGQGGALLDKQAPKPAAAEAPAPAPAPVPAPAAAEPVKVAPELVAKANEVLDAGLAEKDAAIRTEALTALGLSARAGAREVLEKALAEKDGNVRFAAARGLRLLRDPAANPVLEKAWATEKGWAVRAELALAFGATGDKKVVPELLKALEDPRQELKVAAAWALFDIGDRAGAEALGKLGSPPRKGAPKEGTDRWSRKVLKGETEGDAALAARTLAEQGNGADAPILGAKLADAAAPVRLWCAAGILRVSKIQPAQ